MSQKRISTNLLSQYGFSGDLGILSIDIDGNDYWVWESINCVNPSLIICEFNPNFGDVYPIVIPYDPAFERFKAHYSGMYYGASIVALKMLAERKGYVLLGTNSNGVNAFFVRKDLFVCLKHFPKPKVYPALHRDSRNENGSFNYYGQLKKHNEMKHLPVVRVDTGERVMFESLNMPYSKAWLDGIPVPA